MKRSGRMGGLRIRSAETRERDEKNARLRVLKSMNIGMFPDTEGGREAMEIHAEMLKEAHERKNDSAV